MRGNHRNGSDVDTALFGAGINFEIVTKVHALLEEESKMPYLFDVVDYTHLQHKDLQDHVNRVEVVFYERGKQ